MKNRSMCWNVVLSATAALLLAHSQRALACSAFSVTSQGTVLVGKDYDWAFKHGQGGIYLNPRDIERTALLLKQTNPSFQWKSKWGSVTLTQFGIGLPISGMNEKGLVVEILQLDQTRFNIDDQNKKTLNESQWAQYQLDQFSTVDEVASHLEDLRILPGFLGIHYFITDATGKSAVVEFLDGKAHIYQGGSLPFAALTNTPYEIASSKALKTDLKHTQPTLFPTSQYRFQTLAAQLTELKKTQEKVDVEKAFQILDSARSNGLAYDAILSHTQWNIVYDVTHKLVYFRTRHVHTPRVIDFAELHLDTEKKTRVFDMNQMTASTDIASQLKDYSSEFNTHLLSESRFLFMAMLEKYKMNLAIDHANRSPWKVD